MVGIRPTSQELQLNNQEKGHYGHPILWVDPAIVTSRFPFDGWGLEDQDITPDHSQSLAVTHFAVILSSLGRSCDASTRCVLPGLTSWSTCPIISKAPNNIVQIQYEHMEP
jgi:hypothetical protein